MKQFFSSFFIFLSISGFSQPVITSNVMLPVAGDSIQYYAALATGFDPGPAGEDVNWDFSSYTGEPTMEIKFEESNDCGVFGTWLNMYNVDTQWMDWWGESSAHTSERWFAVDDSSFSFCKIGGFEFEMNFNEPYTQMIFPATFGTENTSNYTGGCENGIFGSDPLPFIGSSGMFADAYGTLTLATGIYTDVLRIKVIDSIGCDYGQVDSYYWFKEGVKGPLFKYTKNYSWGYEYIFERKEAVGITGVQNNEIYINVYPNPAVNYLIIEGINSGIAEIYNLNGQLTCSQEIINGGKINTEMLTDGIYLLKMSNSNSATTRIFEKRN